MPANQAQFKAPTWPLLKNIASLGIPGVRGTQRDDGRDAIRTVDRSDRTMS